MTREARDTWLSRLHIYHDLLEEGMPEACAICGSGPTKVNHRGTLVRLVLDHDHETGIVRGLLCNGCNLMLGNAKDSPDILRRGADYLDAKRETGYRFAVVETIQ